MIAALFALAAAMIIGGAAAVVQGFPYVRLESGQVMVIAGAFSASSGAVLLGLAVVALGLRRVERATLAAHAAPPKHLPAEAGRPRLPPVLPPAPFVLPPVGEPPEEAARVRIEPGLEAAALPAEPELPMPGLSPPAPEPAREPEPVAAAQPVSMLSGSPQPEPVRGVAPEDDLFAGPAAPEPPAEAAREEAPQLRPGLDAPEAAAPVETPERTVVGRYSSGGNTYVMFADGAIEADTPQGRFTFASLEELKAFVEGGGESRTRGAA